jgi:hypothetical protein
MLRRTLCTKTPLLAAEAISSAPSAVSALLLSHSIYGSSVVFQFHQLLCCLFVKTQFLEFRSQMAHRAHWLVRIRLWHDPVSLVVACRLQQRASKNGMFTRRHLAIYVCLSAIIFCVRMSATPPESCISEQPPIHWSETTTPPASPVSSTHTSSDTDDTVPIANVPYATSVAHDEDGCG